MTESVLYRISRLMIHAQDLQGVAVDNIENPERESVERPSAQVDPRKVMPKPAGTDVESFA